MNKIKDFIYDKNDIFLALLILACAGLLIFWRINSIINYPAVLAEKAAIQQEEKAKPEKINAENEKEKKSNSKASEICDNATISQSISFAIPEGSKEAAIQALVETGLFESAEDFEAACTAANVDSSAIKAKNYTLEKGATKEDIVLLVTN